MIAAILAIIALVAVAAAFCVGAARGRAEAVRHVELPDWARTELLQLRDWIMDLPDGTKGVFLALTHLDRVMPPRPVGTVHKPPPPAAWTMPRPSRPAPPMPNVPQPMPEARGYEPTDTRRGPANPLPNNP
jgi:hypothetical protein